MIRRTDPITDRFAAWLLRYRAYERAAGERPGRGRRLRALHRCRFTVAQAFVQLHYATHPFSDRSCPSN